MQAKFGLWAGIWHAWYRSMKRRLLQTSPFPSPASAFSEFTARSRPGANVSSSLSLSRCLSPSLTQQPASQYILSLHIHLPRVALRKGHPCLKQSNIPEGCLAAPRVTWKFLILLPTTKTCKHKNYWPLRPPPIPPPPFRSGEVSTPLGRRMPRPHSSSRWFRCQPRAARGYVPHDFFAAFFFLFSPKILLSMGKKKNL